MRNLLAESWLCILVSVAAGCAVQSGGPISAWVASPDAELLPDSPPDAENALYSAATGRVRLLSVLNETVAFQVGLRSSSGLDGARFEVSDLRGPRQVLRSRDVVRCFRAESLPLENPPAWFAGYTGRSADDVLAPEVLVPFDAPAVGGTVRMRPGRTQVIWVDVYVPPTAEPGMYHGQLSVRGARDQLLFTSQIELRVAPVALPGTRSLAAVCRLDPTELLAAHCGWPVRSPEATLLSPSEPRHREALEVVNAAMEMLHAHRATPVLWASFPRYRVDSSGAVEIDWRDYDALVSGWLDGSAFADQVGSAVWPIPLSKRHPDASREGGLTSPRYARLVSSYLSACEQHFVERGWIQRAFLRPMEMGGVDESSVAAVERFSAIARHAGAKAPLMAHLPARSLRERGWVTSAAVPPDLSGIWCPPAMWFEPAALARARALGTQVWFAPDRPPYSPSLVVGGRSLDPRLLAWQAHRYDAQGLWIEHVADAGGRDAGPLLYPGVAYGLRSQPVCSMRLKRLRSGLQDYDLLHLVALSGRPELARSISQQLVRRAFLDAALDDPLDTLPAAWISDPGSMPRVRRALIQALVQRPGEVWADEPFAEADDWRQLQAVQPLVRALFRGARLLLDESGVFRASIDAVLLNESAEPVSGEWHLPDPPPGWQLRAPARSDAGAFQAAVARIEAQLSALGADASGIATYQLACNLSNGRQVVSPARLAVTRCANLTSPLRIDGRLDDWPRTSANMAGNFLRTLSQEDFAAPDDRRPTLATRTWFAIDRETLYIGVQAEVRRGDGLIHRPDNVVPVEGATPWGQDVIEILLDPLGELERRADALFVLQIKPSGQLVARRGAITEPPLTPSEPWASGARVASHVTGESWTLEVALPLRTFGEEALRHAIWGVNVTRLDARRGEYSTWAGAERVSYSPRALGNLIVAGP